MKKKSDSEQKIIETAMQLFQRQGFNATGVNQIITEASVAKSAFYSCFDSKLDLVLAYLDVFQQKWYESLIPFLYSFKEPKDQLLGLFEFRIYYQEKYMFPGCPFTKINSEIGFKNEMLAVRVREGKTYFRAFILDMVRNTNHKQLVGDEELTDLIFLLIEGGLSSAAIYKSTADLKQAKRLVSNFL